MRNSMKSLVKSSIAGLSAIALLTGCGDEGNGTRQSFGNPTPEFTPYTGSDGPRSTPPSGVTGTPGNARGTTAPGTAPTRAAGPVQTQMDPALLANYRGNPADMSMLCFTTVTEPSGIQAKQLTIGSGPCSANPPVVNSLSLVALEVPNVSTRTQRAELLNGFKAVGLVTITSSAAYIEIGKPMIPMKAESVTVLQLCSGDYETRCTPTIAAGKVTGFTF